MSVTWNILCILPCSVNLMFITLLKNQVECIFLAAVNIYKQASDFHVTYSRLQKVFPKFLNW